MVDTTRFELPQLLRDSCCNDNPSSNSLKTKFGTMSSFSEDHSSSFSKVDMNEQPPLWAPMQVQFDQQQVKLEQSTHVNLSLSEPRKEHQSLKTDQPKTKTRPRTCKIQASCYKLELTDWTHNKHTKESPNSGHLRQFGRQYFCIFP